MGIDWKKTQGTFLEWQNILHFDLCGSCMDVHIPKNHQALHFRFVHFDGCEFHFNKVKKNNKEDSLVLCNWLLIGIEDTK